MSVLEMPSRLYMMTETLITMTYGIPSAKYKLGTHSHALRRVGFAFSIPFPFCPNGVSKVFSGLRP